jgi:hypothetical protein
MRLVQFEDDCGRRRVGVAREDILDVIDGASSTRELALEAIRNALPLERHVMARGICAREDYRALLDAGRVLPPLDHEDAGRCLVSGAGLTHGASAATRDSMRRQAGDGMRGDSDAQRLFRWGIEAGRPAGGETGAQPGWFYKGDGSIIVRPGAALPLPEFADDAGEEAELAGLYVIADDGRPYRLGFAIANDFSDHGIERRSALYIGHSKLRYCSFGPELHVGPLPARLSGMSRIRRRGRVIWEKEFLSGQDHMCHSLENLEYHHFKYNQFLRPGNIHVHFFGTPTLSYADGVRLQPGDAFEIDVPEFGEPLVNPLAAASTRIPMNGVAAL